MACMLPLTPEGQQKVTVLAQRYGVSMEVASTLLQALVHGHGTRAQFDHPELGGRGQWMPGGMVMVGDMFNQALKATVDGLCTELAALLAAFPLAPAAPARSPMSSRATPHQRQSGGRATAGTQAPAAGSWGIASPAGGVGAWWPAAPACQQQAARRTPCAMPISLGNAVWPLRSTSMSGSMTHSTIR
jgi:hypothetical protein